MFAFSDMLHKGVPADRLTQPTTEKSGLLPSRTGRLTFWFAAPLKLRIRPIVPSTVHVPPASVALFTDTTA